MKIQANQVVQVALNLLDEVGLENLTMRKLAEKLDIKAATLYWHFKNKQQLIDNMADAIIEDVARSEISDNLDWQKRIHIIACELRSAFNKRRDGALVFSGTYNASENTFRVMGAIVNPLMKAGMTAQDANETAFSIAYYILGFVIEEQALLRLVVNQNSSKHDLLMKQLEKKIKEFPHFQKTFDNLQSLNFEKRFLFGVNLICLGAQQTMKK